MLTRVIKFFPDRTLAGLQQAFLSLFQGRVRKDKPSKEAGVSLTLEVKKGERKTVGGNLIIRQSRYGVHKGEEF